MIMSLPSSMADLVPCDRLMQKAYSLGRTKLTNSLGNYNLNFQLARDQVVLLETAANFCAILHQANDFFLSFFF